MKNKKYAPNSKFLKIRCQKCKNEQVVFSKSSTNLNCLVCGDLIAEATGGKARIAARVLEVLE